LRYCPGQRKRKECRDRFTSHCCDVAKSPRQASPAYFIWPMPHPPEVNILEAEVSGHECLVPGRNAQDGAIVAYPGNHAAGSFCPAANLRD